VNDSVDRGRGVARDSSRAAAVDGLADVLVGHLREVKEIRDREGARSGAGSALPETRQGNAPPPVLVALHGPGGCDLLDCMAPKLRSETSAPDGGWTVVRFDAWQYQRVQPPWWWLVEEMGRQVRVDARSQGRSAALREAWRGLAWRVRVIASDPWVIALLALVAAGLLFFTVSEMRSAVETTAKIVGVVLAIAGFIATVTNALRQRVLFSGGNERAVLRAADPMAAFQARYAFLLRARPAPVAFLVENLDRCRAEYVVEFLEGIQTLLKHRPAPAPRLRDRVAWIRLRLLRRIRPRFRRHIRRMRDGLRRQPRIQDGRRRRVSAGREPRLVAFLVAADEAWLCTSFVEVYKDLATSTSVPGRAIGLASLDKVFDHSLHLPRLPAFAPISSDVASKCSRAERSVRDANREGQIRGIVTTAESAAQEAGELNPLALQRLRIEAVKRLGEIEDLFGQRRFCSDTAAQLSELTKHLDAAAELSSQLRTAYCSLRTAQLLGGHAIDTDDYAICRLGLWALLTLKWPMLAHHLAAYPEDVACLRSGAAPPDRAVSTADVFADRAARQVVIGFPGQAELDPGVIERFTVPLKRTDPHLPTPRTS
jgi:hypothetical protein